MANLFSQLKLYYDLELVSLSVHEYNVDKHGSEVHLEKKREL
ncbi:MAG: hypothetical protein ACFFDW_01320 [Candidatus Thorarchaeota archaeon]